AKKKNVIASANGTNPNHVTRLRDPLLEPRKLIFNNKDQLIPFETTDPWDEEAYSEDHSNTLIPVTPLLDAARQLRHTRHGGEEGYKALVAGWEGELKGLLNRHLFDAAIGVEKAHRQLDRDAWLFLAVEVAKYRKMFRGAENSSSNETKAYKDRVFKAAFDLFPDLAPQNRVFKTPEAQVAYTSQYDTYFRGRVSACDKRDGTPYSSKRLSQLEDMFLAATNRSKTTLDAWLGSLDAKSDLWSQFEQKEEELTTEWLEANPDGDLNSNRLQLERTAKRKVFEEECKKDPKLYDKAKDAAKDLKAKSKNVTAAEKVDATFDALAFLSYTIARITDRADISVTVIAIADCGDASPNAYINQYGYPRGQALADKSPDSMWSKNVTPLISDFVKRISAPGQNTSVRFGEVLPKVEALALETPPGDEFEPESQEIKLVPYDWKAERSTKRAKAYFDANLRKLRGLTGNIMWRSITKNTSVYLHGLPDIVWYATDQFDIDAMTGKINPHPISFRNPSGWDDGELLKWEDHIAKSEQGKLPADQTFAFVDGSGRRYYACSALGKSPSDDTGDATATTNKASTAVDEEGLEDFTDQMAQVQPIDDGDMSDPGGAADLVNEEEAWMAVMKIKKERMEKSSLSDVDNLTAPANTSALMPATQIERERYAVYPVFTTPSEDQLHNERRIRRSLEVIPWKGTPSPVPKGPQLSSAVEAILLDELLGFKDLLPEEFDAAREFAQCPRALADASELAKVLGNTHYKRLLNIEQSPPPIQGAEDLYETAFDSFLIAVLSAVEVALGQLFSAKAFLHLRLGGPRGLIIIFRALSFLFPVYSRPSIKKRFEWAAVRLHYLTTLILSVRRSFLAAKVFLATFPLQPAPSSNSSNPLSTILAIWEEALTLRLQMWSSLIILDDLQSLTQVANPNVFPQRSSGTQLYINITELRWYHVPTPGTPWQIAVPVPSSSDTQTLEFLQTFVADELTGHAAAMRAVSGPREPDFDGEQDMDLITEDTDLITQAPDQDADEEWVDEGNAKNSIAHNEDLSEAVAGATAVDDREPKKGDGAKVTAPTQRILRARTTQTKEHDRNPKRKSTEVVDAETGNEPGPSAVKRPRTRTETAKQLDAVEIPAVEETPRLKGGRTKPKAAAKPRKVGRAGATSKVKAPAKPKANSRK
ncbi:hypothetical protein FRC01_005689, partial [Tulasnella sp. 417]